MACTSAPIKGTPPEHGGRDLYPVFRSSQGSLADCLTYGSSQQIAYLGYAAAYHHSAGIDQVDQSGNGDANIYA